MPYNTLYVDIDSTIWSAEQHYDRAAKELFGVEFGDDWYDVPELIARFGPEYKKLFQYALASELVPERKMYPHAARVLYNLSVGRNFNLHFITHNFHPEEFEVPLRTWLAEKIRVPFDFTIYPEHNSKVDTMLDDPTAWGIIEDKSSTLVDAYNAGYVTIAKRQPWNSLTLQEYPDIMSFDDWATVPDLVAEREGVLV